MSRIVRFKQKYITLRVFVFVTIAIALLFFDYHHDARVEKLKVVLVRIISPMQQAAHVPVTLWREAADELSARTAIVAENQRLNEQLLLLQAENQRMLTLESENEELASLLNATQHVKNHFAAASVLSAGTTAFGEQELISMGGNDQVYNGQAVIDASGLLGQVVAVSPTNSRILLITDQRSAVPVEVVRNGVRAIVMGNGAQGLQLVNMTKLADVREGDRLVTSGMGGRFPAGFPVGVIQHVEKIDGQQFLTITVSPVARTQTSRRVLLIWKEGEYA